MVHVADYRFKFRERTFRKGTSILIDAQICGRRWKKSLGFEIPKGSFNPDTQRLKSKKGMDPSQFNYINSTLSKLQAKAEKIFYDYADRDIPLTVESFKRAFELPDAITLRSFCELHITKEPYKDSSEQQLRRTVEMVCQAYGYEVSVFDISDGARVLEKYMVKKDLAFNTRQKYHSRLKTLIRSAFRNGYRITNPYDDFQVHSIKGTRTFLEAEELETLIELYQCHDLPRHLHQTLETFLFCCFTGLRYSDAMEISNRNIVGKELHCFTVKGQRFSHQLRIPLPEVALRMVEHRAGKLFKQISDQKMNANLKRVMQFAGIKKHITFHCARHTFGTLFIAIGGELMVLKELMGHSKISTTIEYVKMANGIKKNQIKLFDDRFGNLKFSSLQVVRHG